jgi:uncharacterized repeat protein (TIGR01451 family)
VSLDPGDVVHCTFENTDQRGTIIIEKQTIPEGSTQKFSVTDTCQGYEIGDGEETPGCLASGRIRIGEGFTPGWELIDITCNGGDAEFDKANAAADVTIDPGKTVRCVFTNSGPGQTRAVTLTKEAAPTIYDTVGDAITYTYTVTNTGNVTLAGPATVEDDKAVVTCPGGALAPNGGFVTCTATYTITQADIDSGEVTNLATATVNGVESNEATQTVTADQTPAISVAKDASADNSTFVPADTVATALNVPTGSTVYYRFTVTNTGNVTLTNVSLTDNLLTFSASECTNFPVASLAPGASATCTISRTAASGLMTNTATARGNFNATDYTATNAANVFGQSPAISLTKTVNPTTYSALGQVITYTYVVRNTGNVTLTGPFSITDDKLGTFNCGSAIIYAPNATATCTHAYTVQASDLNASFTASITNHATAHITFNGSTVTSNPAQATVSQIRPTAKITPTGTTCQAFKAGTAGSLASVQYSIKAKKINSVNPGVFFYYSQVTATAGQPIMVTQSNNFSWPVLSSQTLGQIVLYDSSCTKVQNATTSFDANGTAMISPVPTSGTYYIGIKYDPNTVVGYQPTGTPTVTYTFKTFINGVEVPTSWASINLVYKKGA